MVDLAAATRQHPWPRHRKTIGVEAEATHQGNIFGIAMIVIAGDITGIAVTHAAFSETEPVPHTLDASVDARRALDLIGGAGGSPDEFVLVCAAAARRFRPRGVAGRGARPRS